MNALSLSGAHVAVSLGRQQVFASIARTYDRRLESPLLRFGRARLSVEVGMRSRRSTAGLGMYGRVALFVAAILFCAPAMAWAADLSSTPITQSASSFARSPGLAADPQPDFRIGPLDTLEITVFGVDSLTRTVVVDAAGQFQYPLIGGVMAAAKTPRQLSEEITTRLAERYLQSPQVTVLVKSALGLRFTVEGAVGSPGVYDIPGQITLLQAIATAKGVSDSADEKKIVVFRYIDGQKRAGVANLKQIRTGKLDDPAIRPGDIIVVPRSNTKGWFRGILQSMPLFNLFLL